MPNNIRQNLQTPNAILQASTHPSFMAVEEGFVNNLGILSAKMGELTESSRVRRSESPASHTHTRHCPPPGTTGLYHVTIVLLSYFLHFCSPLLITKTELLHIHSLILSTELELALIYKGLLDC